MIRRPRAEADPVEAAHHGDSDASLSPTAFTPEADHAKRTGSTAKLTTRSPPRSAIATGNRARHGQLLCRSHTARLEGARVGVRANTDGPDGTPRQPCRA
jgi:hypothetical protein